MSISIVAEKAFDKFQQWFMIKYQQNEFRGNMFQQIKATCVKTTASVIYGG